MKKKSNISIAVKIAVAVVLLAGSAFVFKGAAVRFLRPSYDTTAGTSAKFVKISKWIPDNSEFDISVDVTRALSDPNIMEGVSKMVKKKGGIIAELVAGVLARKDAVGLLALVGALGERGTNPNLAIIAQGSFDEKVMIPAIAALLATGKAGLAREKLGGHTLYIETDSGDPFGFIVLDREHIAVGNRAALAAFFEKTPEKKASLARLSDSLLFGHLSFGPRLGAFIPPGIPISSIDFDSSDGKTLTANIPSAAPAEAQNLRMFLEGVRSLLMLQEEGNAALQGILRSISVHGEGNEVKITCDTLPLLGLW